jgi:hypothetical protein
MPAEPSHFVAAIAIGIGATLLMDLWNLALKRMLGIPSLSYCLLGRWFRYMPEGTFRHVSIAAAAQKPLECPLGWVAHYTIGVVLALGFVGLVSADWLERPTLLPALLYGVVTVLFPFFILQPSFGLGIASSRAPRPARARLKSLVTHTVFGVGLYVCALAAGYLLLSRGGEGLVSREGTAAKASPVEILSAAIPAGASRTSRTCLGASRSGWRTAWSSSS